MGLLFGLCGDHCDHELAVEFRRRRRRMPADIKIKQLSPEKNILKAYWVRGRNYSRLNVAGRPTASRSELRFKVSVLWTGHIGKWAKSPRQPCEVLSATRRGARISTTKWDIKKIKCIVVN